VSIGVSIKEVSVGNPIKDGSYNKYIGWVKIKCNPIRQEIIIYIITPEIINVVIKLRISKKLNSININLFLISK
jgi:hypothetical protein